MQRIYNIKKSITVMPQKTGNQHKTEERKRRLQDRTELVKIHICWKSDQGNKKICKNTNRKLVYTVNNNPQKIAAIQEEDEYKQNGIHKLKHNQCHKVYIG